MAQLNHTSRLVETEEALTVLFCLLDDAYAHLNPCARCYESIKRLSDSEVGSHRPLPAAARRGGKRTLFLARGPKVLLSLVPRGGGAASFLLPSAGEEAQAFFGTPAEGRPLRDGRQPGDAARRLYVAFGFAPQAGLSGLGLLRGGVGEVGSFSVYGVKLHLICATNGVPLSYDLTPANIADVSLTEELLAEAALGDGVARRLLGDLAYRSEGLKEALAEVDILLVTEPSARRRGVRQRVQIAISSLKRVFGLGETLATTLVGLATRIAAKIAAYTYAFAVNRTLGRPQGRIKELWA
jgi:hypothetical protein